ncbi:unnamed protein product [Closterium sp. NIES-54]
MPSDESVEPSGPYPELVGCLMYLMTCTRPDLAYPLSILARYVAPGRHRPEHMAAAKRVLRYLCSTSGMGLVLGGRSPVVLTGHADASWADDQATQRSSQGYTFSLGSGSVSWRSTRSSSVLSSSCEAKIYAGAMAAQELRWLTYLLTDLGEQPRSPPVLYVDNKAMLALCREHRLEHRTKHIALRYVLPRELQQRGQLRLAYVASEANTADIFTKALVPGDHQRFCTLLGFPTSAFSQVFAAASRSSPASAPCSCRPLAHETLLWHHRLGHPSLPRLRGMASRALVSGLPRSLPPLPPGPAPTCVPCVEGRQRAAPHSSSFPPTEAPLQTLHMDVWGPARVRGQGHERYFLLVVDDYSRYTTVFPLRSKGEVTEVLIDWIRGARRQLSESFGSDLPVLRLQLNRGGEFSSDLLRAFCRLEGIRQTFTLPASPQQNGIAERRIGMVMDVAHTSMIHAAAPHFLWPFAVNPAEPVEVAVDSVAARGAESRGAEPGRAEPGGVAPEGTVSGGAEPARAASGGVLGVSSRRVPLSQQQLREWYSRRCRGAAGAGAARGAAGAGAAGAARGAAGATGGTGATRGAAGAGAAGGAAGAGATGGAGAAGGAAGATGGAGAGGAGGAVGTGDPRAEGTGSVSAVSGGTARSRPYLVPLLQQVLGSPPSPGPPPPPFLSPPPVQSHSQLQPASPLPGPSPYSGPTRGLTERREPESRPVSPESRPASPVRTVRAGRVWRPRLPPVPSTHSLTLQYDSLRVASPAVTRFLATAVNDPLFESSAASALVAELVDFAAACRLDYAASLVAESVSASVCPPSVGGECALGTDVLEDRQEDLECFAAASPHLVSMLLAPEGDPDALDIPTPRSYAEAIEGPYSSQWQAAMDAEMASWKSTGTYVDEVPPPGANIAPREWHDTLRTTLAALGFAPSTADPSLFLRTDATRPPFYVLVYVDDLVFATADTEALAHVKSELQKRHTYTDLAPPSDESVEPSGPYPELVGCLITSGMGLVLGGRARVVLTGHADASWRSTRSSSVLSSSCEAEIYAGAMAAQELRWLTYLLTDLGEAPCSPPVLYVDNKAMLALCQEHRLEHKTKHIALRYFLARELQHRGQLRLAYVASQANTADVFTKALQPCDHQRFCTVLGLVPIVPHLLTS